MDNLRDILVKFSQHRASLEEVKQMLLLIQEKEQDDNTLVDFIVSELESFHPEEDAGEDAYWRHRFEGFVQQVTRRTPVRRMPILRYAAAVILIAGAGAYLWNQHSANKNTADVSADARSAKADIAPGRNRAILTLADGSTIILDSAANGTLAQQGGSNIIKKDDQLIYDSSSRGSINPLLGGVGVGVTPQTFNTMSTPRGGQYQLILPDGSRVWLNAASSITYPTAFTGKDRKVSVTGEAYFEVATDKSKPFFVTYPPLAGEARRAGGGQVIEVLGTRFNVNAYADEPNIKVTLLEGAVRISPAASPAEAKRRLGGVILKPGQQASVSQKSNPSQLIPVQTVNVDQAVAWKNGLFNFNGKSLSQVLKELSRWYDLDVVYTGKVPEIYYYGKMQRSLYLSDVLGFLKASGVQFTLQKERTLIVQSK